MPKQLHDYFITPRTPQVTNFGTHWRWYVGKFVPDDTRPVSTYTITAVPLDNNKWSYHCDCPAYTMCKHIRMLGDWLRRPIVERYRWYFSEEHGWVQQPDMEESLKSSNEIIDKYIEGQGNQTK